MGEYIRGAYVTAPAVLPERRNKHVLLFQVEKLVGEDWVPMGRYETREAADDSLDAFGGECRVVEL